MDCSLPGSSDHEILQARLPEWVAMLSSRLSSQPRDQVCVSCLLYWQAGSLFTFSTTREAGKVEDVDSEGIYVSLCKPEGPYVSKLRSQEGRQNKDKHRNLKSLLIAAIANNNQSPNPKQKTYSQTNHLFT